MSIRVGLSARRAMLMVCLGASVFGVAGCGTDPIPQGIIDGLPAESGDAHRPGQPCLVCHSTYGEAQPPLVIGGTVFKKSPMTGKLVATPNVQVIVYGSDGDFRVGCSDVDGNFHITKDNWKTVKFPLKSEVGPIPRRMNSIIGREGSCANCHKLPPAGDPGTGKANDSAGVILVEEGEESPECLSN